jgi:Uma2 family endonuclease
MIVPFKPLPGTTIDPRFPDTDEDGRGASDFHARAVFDLKESLDAIFVADPDAYVTCHLAFCHEEDKPVCRIDPDVMVAKRGGKRSRYSWCIRNERGVPDVIFEIVASETLEDDLYDKPRIYARLGVIEYFLFDPEAAFLRPALTGFRLEGGVAALMKHAADGSLASEQLGLRFRPEGGMLRVFDERRGSAKRGRAK